ncbi:hypothetical protein [Halorussus aquaticus]|uniref:MFS transporter n=1 Tax=Halorussus aquaticus TaxID=2953748 RepID=A0ABD5Q891_9EURY|nr:hypothetical protein [Halorussus aquaticus]
MTDENTTPERYRDGTTAEAAGTDGTVAGEEATDQEAVEDPSDQHVPEEDDRLLARVPEWVVTLGSGSLFTATLITFVGTVFLWYSVTQRRFYGFEPYKVVLLAVQFTGVTLFQALGVRWGRRRIRWMWVMLSAIAGALTFVALPFSAIALVCVGLGKYHFTFDTPSSVIRGER